ncbi:hypothetical protein F4801DRAFT_527503 [Xylaria longipes]|nr:hypothetical protein F4801DRAFT_527503 [Xylaria longipes]RYC58465.1 hypothetical protein CHU98_g7745 [Xylaria longipes]
MQTKILAAVFLFSAFGATQDVDLDDVPRACQQACQDITRLSGDCDRSTDDDTAERDCVCNADNAQQQANSCAACVKANVQNDNDADDDLSDLFSACGWNYADVSPTSSSDTASSTQNNNGTSSTSGVITTTQTFPATTTTETSSGTATTETFPASTVTSTRPASPSETEDPDNGGSGLTVGFGFVAAGLMAALPVVL